jgi:cobalt-zinc-cadmium efflux system outer membrane protein
MHSLSLRGAGCAVLLCVIVAAAPSWAVAPDADAPAPLTPEAAVVAALSVHPNVRAAESELLLARGLRSESSLLLGNPTASGGASLDGERASLSLTQPLSLTGEGWYARSSATARVDAAEGWLRRARLAAAADTRLAYVEAVVATGRVRVATEGVELASRLRHAVSRQSEEGEASTLDLRLARLAEVQAASALLDARDVEADALRTLAALVARPVVAERLVGDPLAAAPEPALAAPSERSDVLAAQAALRAAETELRRQRAASLPPVEVGLFVDVEAGQTFVGPTVGVEIPLFARNQAGRADARGEVLVADARVDSLAARADTEIATAQRRVAEARELSATLVADPVAEAREALRSIEAGYLAGEIDLPTTVLLQHEVLNGEAAALVLLGQVADARLDLLLATEDPQLLGGAR